MPIRRNAVGIVSACLAGLAFVPPADAAEPARSQPLLPAAHQAVAVAQYGPHVAGQPARDATKLHHAPRKLLLRGTVVTMDDDHRVVDHGNVLVIGSKIARVWGGDNPPRGLDVDDAEVVDAGPNGLIFPGLINLHDHPSYDVLPTVPPPSSHAQPGTGRPQGTEPYANRYEWNRTRPPEFDWLVDNASDALIASRGLGLFVEVLKHAEARAILGGETTLQNGSDDAALAGFLVRNADGKNFGRDRVESRVASVNDADFPAAAAALKQRINAGQVDAWLVHLAEGVRDANRPVGDPVSSRQEFQRLTELGLLTRATVILHGVALERDDFAAMHAAGAQLVWSPLSNLLLYGQTTSVYEALAAGLVVSLGTDWTPSGSNNLLDEMKVADRVLRDARLLRGSRALVPELTDDATLDRTIVDMVTRNPAVTLHWPEVGQIAAGKVADILVIRRPSSTPTGGMPSSPYRSLIDATQRDIQLVLVGGKPLAGAVPTLRRLRGDDLEVVGSPAGRYALGIDVTVPDIPKGRQKLSAVESVLRKSLRALGGDGTTFPYLRRHFDGGRYAFVDDTTFREQILAPRYGTVAGRVNLESIALHPLLTDDDHYFFSIIGGLAHDTRPPYRAYAANLNLIGATGNPFAPAAFHDRWWD